MNWIKKGLFGMFLAFFILAGIHLLSAGGIELFKPEFLGLGGLILMLSIGFVETNFVFYE